MPETPYVKFRVPADVLADMDALAASAGNRTAVVRESVSYWYREIVATARRNADELSREEWHLLAHTGTPVLDGDEDGGRYPDWSRVLAMELVSVWEGKNLILPSHREEKAASAKLAKRIAGWGPVRGYALMAALRWFWSHQDTADAWWHPEVWLVAEVREDRECRD